MSKLENARKIINQVDKDMASLFEKRMEAVEAVVEYKLEHDMEVLDSRREQELIEKNLQYIQADQYRSSYLDFFQEMLRISKDYQKSIINHDLIAYQGTYGAFSYIATTRIFENHKYRSYPTFEDVFKAVDAQEVAYGVIPFENSFTGEVGEVSDLLREYDVYITKIYDLKVDQNLLGIKGSDPSKIKKVYSHPQAISQSSLFLKGRGYEMIPYPNTALAAQFVSEQQDVTLGAIASKETATLFGLEILESNIHTTMDNTTRFVVISKIPSNQGNYFQMMFTTKNETGALAKAMNLIASYGFNMESIKSRAIPNEPWSYYFHVEIEGILKDEKTQEMIKKLEATCMDIRILGSYNK
ncbi:chorismate mutase/prephenate dehydratase [Breznakia sp. PF5-3]|uniref:chorismate mutase n=1 Tax=unclassified Breznakia TaxID=2623764 RepID=UPI002405586C|nr:MULTISPECIES: chorismate mutase [unclassified Breznakia]MDF9825260.1 chorismate mutase/prephenate dehydratase [Breznakia sp. PM6-1]MDF9836150.1 chorismate mutase/prephenate dehydratase [Breznakia sp. PF5-3]MDF9838163.1 chorismate mutase/prephenate dehydratase [Breznakia sp. PFB2-8]MDF9860149.1 chorismate mutase/prephenate dehydratase [Breznakia sp. PH5-24]